MEGLEMRRLALMSLCLAAAAASSADAAVTLIAEGTLSGSSAGPEADLSGLGGVTLENGLPGNVLGGLGSGLAYAGNGRFLALPDRGPNATPFNSKVDDTVSYINRFHTLNLDLTPAAPGSSLPFDLTPQMSKTTLLYSPASLIYGTGAGLGVGSGAPAQNTANKFYFTGRSDNFGSGNSGNAADARFDTESIRMSNDAKDVFISDEYGPYVREFDRNTGKLVRTYTLPSNLDVANLSPNGATEISGNTSGRTANKGMEGLALTPDGTMLVGIMQAAVLQDAGVKASKKLLRIVTIDVATGATHEYGYMLTTGSGVSEIVAINNHQFLVDERDGSGLGNGDSAVVKQLFEIDITGAQDITNLSGAAAAGATLVTKSALPFLDLVTALGAHGIDAAHVPAKIEGLAFGQDVMLNGTLTHTLWVANDNDFVPAAAGENRFFVFGFTDADLSGYVAQAITGVVPEPSTWAMMLLGLGGLGGALRLRRARPVQGLQ
jgi:hypothetical protein